MRSRLFAAALATLIGAGLTAPIPAFAQQQQQKAKPAAAAKPAPAKSKAEAAKAKAAPERSNQSGAVRGDDRASAVKQLNQDRKAQ